MSCRFICCRLTGLGHKSYTYRQLTRADRCQLNPPVSHSVIWDLSPMSVLEAFAAKVEFTDIVHQSLSCTDYPSAAADVLSPNHVQAAFEEITRWPGYEASPLHALTRLSAVLGCGAVHYLSLIHI